MEKFSTPLSRVQALTNCLDEPVSKCFVGRRTCKFALFSGDSPICVYCMCSLDDLVECPDDENKDEDPY